MGIISVFAEEPKTEIFSTDREYFHVNAHAMHLDNTGQIPVRFGKIVVMPGQTKSVGSGGGFVTHYNYMVDVVFDESLLNQEELEYIQELRAKGETTKQQLIYTYEIYRL